MADLHISWEEYNKKTEQLASMVHKDGWDFNQVVCIAKGGMRVGDIMARIFDVPLAVLSVEISSSCFRVSLSFDRCIICMSLTSVV